MRNLLIHFFALLGCIILVVLIIGAAICCFVPRKKEFIKKTTSLFAYGFFGGWLVATVVLSFIALIGRLGDTGSDHFGYWSYGIIFLGMFYGIPVGLFLVTISRLMLLKLAYEQFVAVSKWSVLIATIMGCLAGIEGPLLAAPVCIITFVMAVIIIGLISYYRNEVTS